jgi:hypothetical protein
MQRAFNLHFKLYIAKLKLIVMRSIAGIAGLVVREALRVVRYGGRAAFVLAALLALSKSNSRFAGFLKKTPIVSPLKKLGFSLT